MTPAPLPRSHFRRERLRFVVLLLTAYGLGVLGTTTLQSMVNNKAVAISLMVSGLVFHGVALYLVPYGEKP